MNEKELPLNIMHFKAKPAYVPLWILQHIYYWNGTISLACDVDISEINRKICWWIQTLPPCGD